MHQIRSYFEKTVKMSDSDWEFFSSKLKRTEYKKRTALLRVGEVESHLNFIETGSIRMFIPKEENDLTFAFSFSGQFMSAYDSFITQTPSNYQTETITDTVLWSITFDDLQDIYRNTDCGQIIGRKTAESLFLLKVKREQSLLNESAEDRYLNLFTEQPHLIKEIPLKFLASYIGITPQALSRIRKRIS
ncbi:MAG: CarD family transcriptional regulator [Fluviicola sp.]|nr:MAG: CarD family transcriptional regulator [Fluviicola sp.]